MKVCGITEKEQSNVFSVLSAILWLGNIDFKDGGDKSTPTDMDCKYPPSLTFLYLYEMTDESFL